MPARFLAIGHVTRDEFEGEAGWRLGGTVTYTAATAARLGASASLVTRVGPKERSRLEERCRAFGIRLHALPAEVTTTFAFRYEQGRRILRAELRMVTLDGLQLAKELVVLRVAEAGAIEHVVLVTRPLELLA